MDNRQKEDLLIPIDNAIAGFKQHLDTHDRTILSVRFGDGKSFFLSHFIEKEDSLRNAKRRKLTVNKLTF